MILLTFAAPTNLNTDLDTVFTDIRCVNSVDEPFVIWDAVTEYFVPEKLHGKVTSIFETFAARRLSPH